MVPAGAVAPDPPADAGASVATVLAKLAPERPQLPHRAVKAAVMTRLLAFDRGPKVIRGPAGKCRPADADRLEGVSVRAADRRDPQLLREADDPPVPGPPQG